MFGRRVLFLTIIYFHLALAVPNPANGVISRDPAAIGDLSSTSNHAIATRQDGGNKCAKPPQAAEDAAKEIPDDGMYSLSTGCNPLNPRAGKMESCVDNGKEITVEGKHIKAALYSCEGPITADGGYKLKEGVTLKFTPP